METQWLRWCSSMVGVLIGILSALGLTGGCAQENDSDEHTGPPVVAGAVSLDGDVLEYVQISFEDAEGQKFRVVTDKAGQFAFASDTPAPPPGKYAVRITRPAAADSADTGAGSSIPARFNTETELVVDVLSGQNRIELSLESSGSAGDL